MGIIRTILLVVFIIISVLLILLVMVQNDDSNGMGSAFGGQSAAFGSHSASVLTKTTGVLVALFFVTVFALALLSRGTKGDGGLSEAASAVEATDADGQQGGENGGWLKKEIEASKKTPTQELNSATEADGGENAVYGEDETNVEALSSEGAGE